MKKIICIHAVIYGKVQGVFYRQGTYQRAQELNLTGWVKNNEDGTVELRACGTKEAIHQLIEWLKQGPPKAVVSKVDWHEISEKIYQAFVILR